KIATSNFMGANCQVLLLDQYVLLISRNLRYLGQSAQAEITAQIYGGTCLSQIPPHDFYCHPLFRFRHFILI
ncbi:hypothetical protein, partial [Coprococcus comes]|uniref:hypothetical protein n=1 Tax=Coprococcus comes TaxID=410072 RepID=UPI001A9B750A